MEASVKNFVFFIIIVLLLISSVAIAQENVTVVGQIRPRLQISDKDFSSDVKGNTFTELRTRLGVKFTPEENISGFIQIQDSRRFGTEGSTLADNQMVDLHQAYFNIQNLFDLPLSLKAGRMELAYGSQRIIGSVGWHNVGRSFDGGVVTFSSEKLDVDFIDAKLNESGMAGDSADTYLYAAMGNLKMVENYKIQPYIITEMKTDADFSTYTLGLFIAGKHGALSHEIEAAYQMGTQMKDVDIAAMMFTANFNYKLDMSLNPVLSAGVDYLSGDDGKDSTKFKVFNTLYATNHKFYGFMDYFLNIPNHTYGKGLMDIHAKASVAPCEKSIIKLAYHMFSSNADYTLADGSNATSFGSEIDLTLVHKYTKSVKFVGGFSYFAPGDIFKETKGKDASTWAYLMTIVNL